jgi:hypothetical protein
VQLASLDTLKFFAPDKVCLDPKPRSSRYWIVDWLTAFGLFAVTAGVICYALEHRNRSFILAFAFSCALGSIYGFLQGAWPFGLVEIVWTIVAFRRWWEQTGRPPDNLA